MVNDCGNDKLSIIVPVYNCEQYLERCIKSITMQTYTNLEVIIIDDGSTDNSYEVCIRLSEMDSRIVVVHQENRGVAAARNKGLDVSTGAFIGFVDSDDWIDPNMYKILISSLLENDVDIASANFWITNGDTKKVGTMPIRESKVIRNPLEVFKSFAERKDSVDVILWNKVYRKTIFEGIRFPEGKRYEDCYIFAEVFIKANGVVANTDFLYYYYQRKDSIMHTKSIRKNADDVYAYIHNCEVVSKGCAEAIPFFWEMTKRSYIFWRRDIVTQRCSKEERLFVSEVDSDFKKTYKMYSNGTGIKERFLGYFPGLYFKVKRFFKIR